MPTTCDELVDAYVREEHIYSQIMDLVDEQTRVVRAEPNTRVVAGLCEQVQGLMAQIADIEQAIEPVKQHWGQDRIDPDGRLDSVLSAVQSAIDKIAAAQERVQCMLFEDLSRSQRRTEVARTALNARRAQVMYGVRQGISL